MYIVDLFVPDFILLKLNNIFQLVSVNIFTFTQKPLVFTVASKSFISQVLVWMLAFDRMFVVNHSLVIVERFRRI